ncbi:MAG: DUF4249 domain-containing protein [Lewinellaceae bacterium]|nr:DUF4249 domain-containing protein [Lewinellaceae bacterium]
MKRFFPVLLVVVAALVGCEKEFIPDEIVAEAQIVVEGYIESGAQATPPYVILTRSVPFFSELDSNQFNDLFVHGATVDVNDGERTLRLTEVCLRDLPPELQREAARVFGFSADTIGFDFCVYTDPTFGMLGQEGRIYTLRIDAEGQLLQATTTIPRHVGLDSLRFSAPPGEPNDTLVQLRCFLNDPPGMRNYYRYQTRINDGPLLTPFGSVTDDLLFDGQSFAFPLPKAEARGADIDIKTFGLYRLGDTVTIKWMNLDKAHFDFWNTVEFNAANQGPFSSYTRVSSNIQGGLGIWGGLSASYYELPIAR